MKNVVIVGGGVIGLSVAAECARRGHCVTVIEREVHLSGRIHNKGVLTLEGSLAARDHTGGTAPQQVEAAISRARKYLAD